MIHSSLVICPNENQHFYWWELTSDLYLWLVILWAILLNEQSTLALTMVAIFLIENHYLLLISITIWALLVAGSSLVIVHIGNQHHYFWGLLLELWRWLVTLIWKINTCTYKNHNFSHNCVWQYVSSDIPNCKGITLSQTNCHVSFTCGWCW